MKQTTFEWFATVEVKAKSGSKRKGGKVHAVAGVTSEMPILVINHVAIGGGK
jgi:hypothetical protein